MELGIRPEIISGRKERREEGGKRRGES